MCLKIRKEKSEPVLWEVWLIPCILKILACAYRLYILYYVLWQGWEVYEWIGQCMSKSIFFNPHCVKVTLAEKEVVPLSFFHSLWSSLLCLPTVPYLPLYTMARAQHCTCHCKTADHEGWGISKFSSRFQELLCNYGHCLHGWARTVTFQWVLVKDTGQESVMA